MMKRLIYGGCLAAALVIGGCGREAGEREAVPSPAGPTLAAAQTTPSPVDPTLSPAPGFTPAPAPTPVTYRTTLGAIGDILLHNTVYQDAAADGGSYDFQPMLSLVAEKLDKPGILVANQESLMGGSGLGLSSYPLFNSPFEIGDALKEAGVDLVTMANNHTLDKGEKGILAATERLNRIGLPYAGAYASPEDREAIRILESRGIRFAFLAYTCSTNGIPVPSDKPYLVALADGERMREELARAGGMADFTVVSMHWGTENETLPNAEQREWARKLADWGADIIIGTHPHVLQPAEWIPRSDGGRTLVLYSLGNFLSAQDRLPQLIGGIATVEAVKTVQGDAPPRLSLENPALVPTYNKYKNWRNYRVVPFDKLEQADWETVAGEWDRIRGRLLLAMPELQVPQ